MLAAARSNLREALEVATIDGRGRRRVLHLGVRRRIDVVEPHRCAAVLPAAAAGDLVPRDERLELVAALAPSLDHPGAPGGARTAAERADGGGAGRVLRAGIEPDLRGAVAASLGRRDDHHDRVLVAARPLGTNQPLVGDVGGHVEPAAVVAEGDLHRGVAPTAHADLGDAAPVTEHAVDPHAAVGDLVDPNADLSVSGAGERRGQREDE